MNTEICENFNGYLELEKQCNFFNSKISETKSLLNQINGQIQIIESSIEAVDKNSAELVEGLMRLKSERSCVMAREVFIKNRNKLVRSQFESESKNLKKVELQILEVTNEFEEFYLCKEKEMVCDFSELFENKRQVRILEETVEITALEAALTKIEEKKKLIKEIVELETKLKELDYRFELEANSNELKNLNEKLDRLKTETNEQEVLELEQTYFKMKNYLKSKNKK